MCVRKSGGGDTLLRGLAHPLGAKIGKVELVEASSDENKTSELQDHLDSVSRCEAKEQEAKNGSISLGNGYGMHQGEENVVVPKETNLSGVLESLMSLDPRGDFMGPLDGFSAPNHSKVIEAPMCFAMMQEKIRTQQYSTWRVFVGDFERICYNALRCNQKRSIIWAAADDLLRRGKKRLEQYEGLGESLIALNKTGGSLADLDSKTGVLIKSKSENVEARVCQDDKSVILKDLKMAITSATSGSAESKPSSSEAASLSKDVPAGKDACLIQRLKEEKREDQMSGNATTFLAPVLDVSEEISTRKDALKSDVTEKVRSIESSRSLLGGPAKISPALGQTDEDIDVDGERNVNSEDHRLDTDGDATESSSSYGSAGSAMEGEVDSDKMQSMFEAESDLRDGNGAVGLLEDDDGLPTNERGKKALDTDWKLYRRGIEWRCHWLELRTQAIKAKIGLYDKLLRSAQSEKIWKWEGVVGEGTSARTVPVKILRNHPVIHCKHRRRAEDALDLDLGRHPVFSRYEKRKIQRKSDDGFGSTQEKVDSQQVQQPDLEINEPEATFEKEYVEQQAAAGAAFVGQDSMEQLLWQVEALQVRVKKQKHILKKEAAVRKSGAAVSKAGLSNLSPRTLPPNQRGNSSPQVLPSPKALPRVGPPSSSASLGRTSSGSGLARRRASDYDINNMVMPVNVGATFVEHVRHVDIETPLWRLIEDGNPAVLRSEQSSSDEESDDEQYVNRHAVMEVLERQQRYMPRLKKSTGDIHTVGKGKLKLGIGKSPVQMTGKGNSAGLSLPSGPAHIVARSADNVPKRQRSSRNAARRVSASQLDSAITQNMSLEVTVVKAEVKSEVPVEDADVNPLGVESSGLGVTPTENSTLDRMDED